MIEPHFPTALDLPRARSILRLVQNATGPERGLDHRIFMVTAPDESVSHWEPLAGNEFTYSVDRVLRLFDLYLPGWEPGVGSRAGRPRAYATRPSPLRPMPSVSKGRPSRALALLEVFFLSVVAVLEERAEADLALERASASTALPDEARLPVGELVKLRRNRSGWTQDELAARAGLSQRTISGIERGTNRYGLRQVLATLGLDPSAVLPADEPHVPLRSSSTRRRQSPPRG